MSLGRLDQSRAEVSRKEALLLTQRALILLGSTSDAINLERRKIKINSSLKGLATETYDKRCLDQVFWKRLLRKLKHRKPWQKSLQSRHLESDLGIMTRWTCVVVFFLSKGTSAKYGSRNQRHNKPHSKPHQQFKQQQQSRGQPPLQAKSSK